MDSLQSVNVSNPHFSLQNSENIEEDDGILEAIPVVTDSLDGGWFGKIGTSLILVFGTFGNVMTILILRKLRSGWSAMNVYLTALAISDTAMLYSGALPMWTRKVINFDLFASHVVACKVMIWVMNTTAALSAWLLVALTAQRAASVVWPHRINILCTRQKSVIIIVSITSACSLLYSHTLFGYDLVQLERNTSVRCTFGFPDYQHFWVSVWVRVDMFAYCLLPCSFLILCNAVLGWKLRVSVKEVNKELSSVKGDQTNARKKIASSTTVTIIMVSTAFVVITLPLMIYNSFFHGYASQDNSSRHVHYFLYDFFFVFGFCNFAWNFYLYCLTGTKFRSEFLKILFGCCRYSSPVERPMHITESTHSCSVGKVQKKNLEKKNTDDF